MGVAKNRDRLPREVVKLPSLEVFKTQLHGPAQDGEVEMAQAPFQHKWFCDSVTAAANFKACAPHLRLKRAVVVVPSCHKSRLRQWENLAYGFADKIKRPETAQELKGAFKRDMNIQRSKGKLLNRKDNSKSLDFQFKSDFWQSWNGRGCAPSWSWRTWQRKPLWCCVAEHDHAQWEKIHTGSLEKSTAVSQMPSLSQKSTRHLWQDMESNLSVGTYGLNSPLQTLTESFNF